MSALSPFPRYLAIVFLMAAAGHALGCRTVYYDTMERFGYEKRDILVDRVASARQAQEATKEQFESALDQLIAVTQFAGGDLEKQYRKLSNGYEDSATQAAAVSERIAAVEQVAGDLFQEWEREIEQYSNESLRQNSQRQLRETYNRYQQLITAMKRAEQKIDPVLAALHDQVLYLKHNLNAQAIAALRTDLSDIEADVAALIQDMNASIAEADAFLRAMSSE